MKMVLITDEGIERVDVRKIEPSVIPGYLVIDEDHAVEIKSIMAIVED